MTAFVALGVVVMLQTPAAKIVDFSGYWIPDPGKATFTKELKAPDPDAPEAPPPPPGDLPPPPPLRIASRASDVMVEYIVKEGVPNTTLKLASDGREVTNPRGMLSQVSSSHWDDGAFITSWELHRRGVAIIKGTDTWRLSADGKTLTIESHMEDSKSRSSTTMVYSRKD